VKPAWHLLDIPLLTLSLLLGKVTCPFDHNHYMPEERLQYHLAHCKAVSDSPRAAAIKGTALHVFMFLQRNQKVALETCPFDFTHFIPKELFEAHLRECPKRPQNAELVDFGYGLMPATKEVISSSSATPFIDAEWDRPVITSTWDDEIAVHDALKGAPRQHQGCLFLRT